MENIWSYTLAEPLVNNCDTSIHHRDSILSVPSSLSVGFSTASLSRDKPNGTAKESMGIDEQADQLDTGFWENSGQCSSFLSDNYHKFQGQTELLDDVVLGHGHLMELVAASHRQALPSSLVLVDFHGPIIE